MNLMTRFGGEYQLRVLDARTRRVQFETPWFDNLITTIGLDQIAAGTTRSHCRIGTGTTAPSFADTALVSQSASTNSVVSQSNTNSGSPLYETTAIATYEFALGAVVGNMAEIGVGWAASGATLFSRALIVNGGGTPAAITVTSAQILQASYRFKSYPTLSDGTGTVVIGGVTHSYTARSSDVGSARGIQYNSALVDNANMSVFNGSLGANTSQPTGGGGSVTGVASTYVAGNFYRDFTFNGGISQLNMSGGITAVTVSVGSSGAFRTQVGFSPAIAKTSSNQLSLPFRQAWARH